MGEVAWGRKRLCVCLYERGPFTPTVRTFELCISASSALCSASGVKTLKGATHVHACTGSTHIHIHVRAKNSFMFGTDTKTLFPLLLFTIATAC